jgi:integrase
VKVKPKKPNAEFPLFAANNGQWAKKIRGKKHYFGVWADPSSALQRYLYEKDYLTQGLPVPGVADPSQLTVADAVNGFLNDRADKLDAGELTQQTFSQYERFGKILAKELGRDTPLTAVGPDQLKKLRRSLASTRSPVALKGAVTCCRMILNHPFDDGLTDQRIRFGKSFSTPTAKALKKHKAQVKRERGGRKDFEAGEVRDIIAQCSAPLKAMTLLGLNAGFSSTDIAELPINAVKGEWLEYPRVKTGTFRRVWLWPETQEAIAAAMEFRPHAKLVFVTRNGNKYRRVNEKGVIVNSVGQQFEKAQQAAGTKISHRGHYGLRHTLETIGGEVGDQVAVDVVMGHTEDGMAKHYRQRVGDDRVKRVCEHVRDWLFAEPTK